MYGLSLYLIERLAYITGFLEIDSIQVYAANLAVMHGPEVEFVSRQVAGYGYVSCARDVYHFLAFSELHSDRNVGVVKQMECLSDGLQSGFPYWGRVLKECHAYESRWRRKVSRKSQHPGTAAE